MGSVQYFIDLPKERHFGPVGEKVTFNGRQLAASAVAPACMHACMVIRLLPTDCLYLRHSEACLN